MHSISGLIAEAAVLDRIASRLALATPAMLSLGFGFLPLDNTNLDKVVGRKRGDPVEGFDYLTSGLIKVLRRSSRAGDFAYIETEYSGGAGTQGAAVFQSGALKFGPKRAEIGPINEALAMLGMTSGDPPDDAFERVGLGRHRSNGAIREADQQRLKPSQSPSGHRRLRRIIWRWVAAMVAMAVAAAAAVIAANAGIEFKLPALH